MQIIKDACYGCGDEFPFEDSTVIIDGHEFCLLCAEIEASKPERDGPPEVSED